MLRCGNRSCAESVVSRDHLVSRLQDLQQQVGVAQKLLRDGELGETGSPLWSSSPFPFIHSDTILDSRILSTDGRIECHYPHASHKMAI